MARTGSPAADRRALANALRQLRDEAGLSLERAAQDALDASGAKLSRIETGKQVAGPRDVRDLCRLYGASEPETAELLAKATSAREAGWWDEYGVNDDDYIGLESAATHIAEFASTVLPGLLQTEAYARAFVERTMSVAPIVSRRWTNGDVNEWLKIREIRQRVLDPGSGVQLHFILDEALLLRPVGGNRAMRDQLTRLIEIAEQSNVEMMILPLSAGAHPGQLGGNFSLLTLPPGNPDIAYVESQAGFQLIDEQREVRRFERLFEIIREACPENPGLVLKKLDEVRLGLR